MLLESFTGVPRLGTYRSISLREARTIYADWQRSYVTDNADLVR